MSGARTRALLGVTVTGVSGWHWWLPLPSPCCCLGTAELRQQSPWTPWALTWAQGAPSPQSSDPEPPWQHWSCVPWCCCVPWWLLCQSGGRGAAGLWFLSEPGPAHSSVPLLGSGFGDSPVSPACPAELAQPWAGVQDRDVPAPAPRWPWRILPSTAALRGREVISAGALGLYRLLLLLSPPLFPLAATSLAQLWGMQLPQCSTSSSAPSLPWGFHPKQPWDPLGCPCVPGCGTDSSVPPSWGGKVCSCFCLFAMFIPRLSSPLAAGMECPWSSQASDLALACSSQAAPAPQPPTAAPSLAQPWAPGAVSCSAALGSIPLLGLGQAGNSSRQESCPPMHLHHFPFFPHGQPTLRLLGWG